MKTLLIGLLSFICITASAQATVNGVTMPATQKAGSKTLVLNGAGVRKKMMFKVYVAGLYLANKNKSSAAILNSNDPVAVRMQITSSMVNSKNMSESMREGFSKSTKGQSPELQKKINSFVNAMSQQNIKEGDVFFIYYDPAATAVIVQKGGKVIANIKGADFRKAIFGIWIGSDPIDSGLKAGMMKG